MFGRLVNFPTDESAVFDADPCYTVDQETYLQAFNENLVQILGDARKNADVAREGNRMEFNNRPNVTIGKFAVGDRVMLIITGEKQNSRWKKLIWNHFGPYKIEEIADLTAKIVPYDAPETESIETP